MKKTEIFFVEGVPAPQGSKTLIGTKTGSPRMIEGSSTSGRLKLKTWRQQITATFQQATPIGDQPVHVTINFYLPHLKNSVNTTHAVKPDLDKLCRAVFDGISDSGYWKDDSRVTSLTATKERGFPTGAQIIIETTK